MRLSYKLTKLKKKECFFFLLTMSSVELHQFEKDKYKLENCPIELIYAKHAIKSRMS